MLFPGRKFPFLVDSKQISVVSKSKNKKQTNKQVKTKNQKNNEQTNKNNNNNKKSSAIFSLFPVHFQFFTSHSVFQFSSFCSSLALFSLPFFYQGSTLPPALLAVKLLSVSYTSSLRDIGLFSSITRERLKGKVPRTPPVKSQILACFLPSYTE